CVASSGSTVLGFPTTETDVLALPILAIASDGVTTNGTTVGAAAGGAITNTCVALTLAGSTGNATDANNVVREAKTPVSQTDKVNRGQIDLADGNGVWPFIQLYELNPTGNVVVQYNKGGGVQSTTLTFDTVDHFANLDLDRSVYPRSAQVHATITDLWLNIDPTDEDSWTFATNTANTTRGVDTFYQVFDENGASGGAAKTLKAKLSDLMCEDNCVLKMNTDAQSSGTPALTIQDNGDTILTQINSTGGVNNATSFGIAAASDILGQTTKPVTITEQGPNSGVFGTYDESDKSVLKTTSDAKRGTSASIDYNETPQTILIGFDFATIDIQPIDDEWSSGEEIPVVIVDADQNKNSRADEDLDLDSATVSLIPALSTGTPYTLGTDGSTITVLLSNGTLANPTTEAVGAVAAVNIGGGTGTLGNTTVSTTVQAFSQRAMIATGASHANTTTGVIAIDTGDTLETLKKTIYNVTSTSFSGFNYINYDVTSFAPADDAVDIYITNGTTALIIDASPGVTEAADTAIQVVTNGDKTGYNRLNTLFAQKVYNSADDSTQKLGIIIQFSTAVTTAASTTYPIVLDFFSFGFTDDGVQSSERKANQIIRIEAEETSDNSGTFEGSLEYIMVNQVNILDSNIYDGLTTIADDPSFIVIEDLTDEDAPRVSYNDLGADGVVTPVSDQEEAPSHSGVVSLNADSYKIADTVVITLEDLDLNVDSDLIDIFTVVNDDTDTDDDVVGTDYDTFASNGLNLETLSFGSLSRLLDVTFDDVRWQDHASCAASYDEGLQATGFTLVETGPATGVFVGDFQIPKDWCRNTSSTSPETVTGLDIEVNYVDFRDASGEIVEVGDSAGVRANTGSVSLDRTVYPVPFGTATDFATNTSSEAPSGRALFPVHASGLTDSGTTLNTGEYIADGDLTIHVRVNDPDFNINGAGEDSMDQADAVKISVIRGSNSVVLGYAGAAERDGKIDVGGDNGTISNIRSFGTISEIAPDAGIYELDVTLKFTDGPASSQCPNSPIYTALVDGYASGDDGARFDTGAGYSGEDYCILQGDILQVEYTDPTDASGDSNTVTDSATFDLRNGVLQSDKSVYIIGSDMILTLIEPDFDLDNDSAETYDLDLIEWDSDAATLSMGNLGGTTSNSGADFDPEPTDFRETGDSTGIFQVVIEIPESLGGDKLERGEEIILEYTDWGPSGSDYVGEEDEDVNLTIYTSNFGATVELDQKVYTWTDKVYITIVAPDHNFDSDLIDEIGNSADDPIKISTRGFDIDQYKLVETGTDTGIFTGEVILTGFSHDANGDGTSERPGQATSADSTGPTNGFIETDDDDGLTVSFEFSEDETIVGSALIRWNIGEVQWLEASYPASGTGVVRVIDPDMNLDPEAVDNFDVDVWSDSDAGGIDLTV
ncbi:MAG: hypothetical protein EA446_08000, partial [Nitrosopumilus sp.]